MFQKLENVIFIKRLIDAQAIFVAYLITHHHHHRHPTSCPTVGTPLFQGKGLGSSPPHWSIVGWELLFNHLLTLFNHSFIYITMFSYTISERYC